MMIQWGEKVGVLVIILKTFELNVECLYVSTGEKFHQGSA